MISAVSKKAKIKRKMSLRYVAPLRLNAGRRMSDNLSESKCEREKSENSRVRSCEHVLEN